MTCVAIIPARGGSVRLPRKNIKVFRGKPMMQWPIEAAKASLLFDEIVVSTDDDEIAGIAEHLGCVVHVRAKDDGTKGTQEVAAEVLKCFDHDVACVIYPCSPLLSAGMLVHGYAKLERSYVRSVCIDGQDAGCFYWGKAASFVSGVPLGRHTTTDVVIAPGRCIDIDTPDDWARAEAMFDKLREGQ